MCSADAGTASRFLSALATAARSGDWDSVYALLAPDVEWVTRQRTLCGIDEVRNDLTWASPPEQLDLEFELGDVEDLGGGEMVVNVVETYRMKQTGDFAYQRKRRIELAVGEQKIRRYEMRIVG